MDITLDDCKWYTRKGNLIYVCLNDEYWTNASGVLSGWQAEQMKDLPESTWKSLTQIMEEADWSPPEEKLKSLE